jgi:hypothetical protein
MNNPNEAKRLGGGDMGKDKKGILSYTKSVQIS